MAHKHPLLVWDLETSGIYMTIIFHKVHVHENLEFTVHNGCAVQFV